MPHRTTNVRFALLVLGAQLAMLGLIELLARIRQSRRSARLRCRTQDAIKPRKPKAEIADPSQEPITNGIEPEASEAALIRDETPSDDGSFEVSRFRRAAS